jgi:hypothetical protein
MADEAIKRLAAQFHVSPAIHPEDHIWNFVMSHPGFSSKEDAINYYFADGAKSADKFVQLVADNIGYRPNRLEVLEFASGYGCVTRHLRNHTGITVWSCDIHNEAVRFLREEIGVRSVLSAPCPEDLVLSCKFDVVFALSFFSHMPISTWCRWLVRLATVVRAGGLIIFTTHGSQSRSSFGNPEIPANGFWFTSSSEQADLSVEEYGQTIVTPDFVRHNIASIPSIELVELREGDWWGHQDTYVVRKRTVERSGA